MSIVELEEKLDFTENAIRKNVNAIITRLQREQVAPMKMDDLFRITPTDGVMFPCNVYRPMFDRIARKVCLKRAFPILGCN